jgi:hypothetical protein
MLGRSTSVRRQDAAEIPVSLASGVFFLLEEWTSDLNSELTSNSNTKLLCFHIPRTPLISHCAIFFSVSMTEKNVKKTAT